MDIDTILLETEEQMEKAVNFLKSELRGIRTDHAVAMGTVPGEADLLAQTLQQQIPAHA